MTLKEAIKILEKEEEDTWLGSEREWKAAVKLGIEAIKRCQYIAKHTDRWAAVLLPGETEE